MSSCRSQTPHSTSSPATRRSTTSRILSKGSPSYAACCARAGQRDRRSIRWEYDRTILEHRYTGPELAALLEGWDDVRVVENGGRGVAWATLTGSILERARRRLPPVRPLFAPVYVVLNGLGSLLDALEGRASERSITLPMNLLATARKPGGA